jgi:hypothetical protein
MDYLERFWYEPFFRTHFANDHGPVFSEDAAERIPFLSLASLFVYTGMAEISSIINFSSRLEAIAF